MVHNFDMCWCRGASQCILHVVDLVLWSVVDCSMQQIRMFLPAATSVSGKAGCKTGSITAPSHLSLIRVTRDITV